jgi:hypothetical protein
MLKIKAEAGSTTQADKKAHIPYIKKPGETPCPVCVCTRPERTGLLSYLFVEGAAGIAFVEGAAGVAGGVLVLSEQPANTKPLRTANSTTRDNFLFMKSEYNTLRTKAKQKISATDFAPPSPGPV